MKSQSSMEYMLLIASVMIAVAGILYYAENLISYHRVETNAEVLLSQLESSVRDVALMGESAKETIDVHVPSNVDASRTFVSNGTINYGIITSSGTEDFFRTFDFCVKGSLPTREGYYRINITFVNGCVILGHN